MADDIPAREHMTAAWLEERFGTHDAPGWSAVVEGDDEEQTFERTGTPTAMCWGSAREVVAELGEARAEMTGYFCRDDSASTMADHAEGHDLAIVDGRFLVDGWAAHVAGIGPCVLDLSRPEDLATARRIHESFECWTVQPGILAGMEETKQKEAA